MGLRRARRPRTMRLRSPRVRGRTRTMTTDAAFDKESLSAALARDPFRPAPGMRNAHVQTCWSSLLRPRPKAFSHRERLPLADGDTLSLHVAEGLPGAPTVLLLHGLEGSAQSHYIANLALRFVRIGWSAVAMEFRTCDGRMNRARRMYHSGDTADVAAVLAHLRERWPRRSLYAVGHSLGANVLGKYLGERGAAAPLAGAALVSPPFALVDSCKALDTVLGGFYARRFLHTLLPKALAKERQYPRCLDARRVARCRTIWEFDDAATAPLHGFAGARDYYERCGCGQFLPRVAVPTLVLAAEDDPMNPAHTIPRRALRESPWIVPAIVRRGGHLGFLERRNGRLDWWAERTVLRFLRALDA